MLKLHSQDRSIGDILWSSAVIAAAAVVELVVLGVAALRQGGPISPRKPRPFLSGSARTG